MTGPAASSIGAPKPASAQALVPHDGVDGPAVGSVAALVAVSVCCRWITPPSPAAPHDASHRAGGVHRPGRLPHAAGSSGHSSRRCGPSRPWPSTSLLLLFASSCVALSALSASNSAAVRTPTASYFTVSVFSTVGFGDITAKTGTAQSPVVTGRIDHRPDHSRPGHQDHLRRGQARSTSADCPRQHPDHEPGGIGRAESPGTGPSRLAGPSGRGHRPGKGLRVPEITGQPGEPRWLDSREPSPTGPARLPRAVAPPPSRTSTSKMPG